MIHIAWYAAIEALRRRIREAKERAKKGALIAPFPLLKLVLRCLPYKMRAARHALKIMDDRFGHFFKCVDFENPLDETFCRKPNFKRGLRARVRIRAATWQAARREDDARGARPVRHHGGAGEMGAAHTRRTVSRDESRGEKAKTPKLKGRFCED